MGKQAKSQAAVSLLDDVLSRVEDHKPGFPSWFEKLPTELQGELRSIRDEWHAGRVPHQKRALARAIISVAKERGHQVPGVQGIETWLGRSH